MKVNNILFLAFFSTVPLLTSASTTVKVVERPGMGTACCFTTISKHLHPSALIKLPVGAVQPRGWLRVILERQRDGLNGQLGIISAWLDKNNNQWLSDSGDHGWEEVPYWLRGYSSLAYILGDSAMEKEAQVWFDAVLKNQKADGFLGPKNISDGKTEVWAQMPMLWALQTYYEHSGDKRVLTAMTRYFLWELKVPDADFVKTYWENKRTGDNMWSVIWLYDHTKNDSILPLIDKLHRCGADWVQAGRSHQDWDKPKALPNWHGVNVAQGFREPATYFVYSGDSAHLQATYDDYNIIRLQYGQVPGGMYGADENARQGYFDPRQGTETCAMVEQMASDEILLSITGDPFWADNCEDVALNSFTAALTPDMKALRYLTAPNMAISDEKLHGPSIDNNLRGMLSMSPFSSRCCQHNHGMGWPYYAEHLIMATPDGGLATMLYAANETTALVADSQTVKITEDSHYPFDGKVELSVAVGSPVSFPLYLRVPAWAEDARVSVNGFILRTVASKGKYVNISRKWKNGDKVKLILPMKLHTKVWQGNKASESLYYGPLALSLKIDEIWEKHDSRDKTFVQDDSHWQKGVDASKWPSYALKPASKWNYALCVDPSFKPINFKVEHRSWREDDNPFTVENSPLQFFTDGVAVPSWGYDSTGMTDLLPAKWAKRDSKQKRLKLIPMGAARLRISAFPTEVVPAD